MYIPQPEAIPQPEPEATLSRSGTLTRKLIRNPAMPFDEPSNRQSNQYRTKIESYYTGSDARRMWQGLQTIRDYKGMHSHELPSERSLPERLNYFNDRFEASNTESCMRASAVPDDCVFTLSVADVRPLGQHSQGLRARWITRTCTLSMR